MLASIRYRPEIAIAAVVCALAVVAFAENSAVSRGVHVGDPNVEMRASESSSANTPSRAQRSAAPSANRAPSASSASNASTALSASSAPSESDKHAPTLESARQRWERLTPEEKLRARERYEKYLALSDAERAELAERAQRLKDSSARVQRELTPEARERLSTLDPEKRRELIGEIVAGEAKENGQRIRGMLPDQVVKRLEAARPEDRARFLADFKQKQRKRVARYAIDQIGRRLALPAAEIDRLKGLPDEERARAVLDLKKQLSEHEAQEFGLLPGVSQSEWDAWEKLPPEEFYDTMQRYLRSRTSPESADHGAHDTNGAPGSGVSESGVSASASGAQAKSAAESTAPPRSPETARALRKLAEARRMRPSDFLDLAHLSRAERAVRVEHRRRERCLTAIREGELLPSDRIAELETASDAAFFDEVRKLLGTAVSAPRPARDDKAPAHPR